MPHRCAPIAVCFVSLPDIRSEKLLSGTIIQVFPAGTFSAPHGAMRGTGPWRLDEAAATALMTRVASRKGSLVIDYEHQSLLAASNGQPAPAAGWVRPQDLFWTDEGLFAHASWTDRAKAMIESGEYRFLSPVFTYDGAGTPTDLLNLALTNNPAIDGMQPVMLAAASRFHPTREKPMLKDILDLLDIDAENPSDEDIIAACAKVKAKTAKADEALAAAAKAPDPAQFAPVAALKALQDELAALRARETGREIDDLVKPALSDGRLLPPQEQWARDLGKSNIAALRAYLETARPIAALKGQQTDGKAPDGAAGQTLTDEEQAVCRQLGISADEFLKVRTAP